MKPGVSFLLSTIVPPAIVLIACASASDESKSGIGRPTPGSGGGGGSVNPSGGSGSGPIIVPPTPTGDPNDDRDFTPREQTCDAAGVCTCLRLALLGTLDSAANQKDTTPFMTWLNANSGGTATVTMVMTKPTLDAAFLANYDILVVANVNGWSFSAEEKAAVENWVRTTAGGIITLTGFLSVPTEPAATSQLTGFSGVVYNSSETAPEGTSQSVPILYNGVDLRNCFSWSGAGTSDAFITAPVAFIPQTGSLEKLTAGINYVGAFKGFGVEAPEGATVVAKDPVTQLNMAVAREVDATGRIFAWGDEWVIYANQWEPTGEPSNKQEDQYNPCWVPPSGDQPGYHHSVATVYQTKQFWYNAIKWVAPPNKCDFVIIDEHVVIY